MDTLSLFGDGTPTCWTCKHLIYNMATKAYKCRHNGKTFVSKYHINKPTKCPDWGE